MTALKTLKQAYDKGYMDGYAKGRETGRERVYPVAKKIGWAVLGAIGALLVTVLAGC